MVVDKTSSDGFISYNDEAHIYWETENPTIKYTSCTTGIGKFFPKFVADMNNTRRTREEKGMTFEEVVAMWDAYRDESCAYGTEVHLAMEEIFLNKPNMVAEPKLAPTEEYYKYCAWAFDENIKWINSGWEAIPEALVYDKKSRLAGQADLPWFNHSTKKIVVTDFKTNRKSMSYDDPYEPNMLEPFETFTCGELMKYGIQLAIYSIFLEREFKGYTVDANIIYHLRDGKVEEITHTGSTLKFFRDLANKIIKIYEEVQS